MEGPTIRDYIDARKKSGMSWDEFRELKDKNSGAEFSDKAMLEWRRQLDAERDAKLSKKQAPKERPSEERRNDKAADSGDERHRPDRRHRRADPALSRHPP
ncbi:hypothetical protein IWQ56_004897, partial [Coemansia nantahalensis]